MRHAQVNYMSTKMFNQATPCIQATAAPHLPPGPPVPEQGLSDHSAAPHPPREESTQKRRYEEEPESTSLEPSGEQPRPGPSEPQARCAPWKLVWPGRKHRQSLQGRPRVRGVLQVHSTSHGPQGRLWLTPRPRENKMRPPLPHCWPWACGQPGDERKPLPGQGRGQRLGRDGLRWECLLGTHRELQPGVTGVASAQEG